MSRAKSILDAVAGNLALIQSGNIVDIQGNSYTYQTDLGNEITQGLSLLDTESAVFPAASITGAFAVAGNPSQNVPDDDLLLAFSIEAADKINGRDRHVVAFNLLEDIRAAVDVNLNLSHSGLLRAGAPGQRAWEFQYPKSGSDLILIRSWYHVIYSDIYRYTE